MKANMRLLSACLMLSAFFSFNQAKAERDYIPPYHEGWPIAVAGGLTNSPGISDIDPDYPGLEIVAGGTGLKVWHADGTFVNGWPIMLQDWMGNPAIADLDPDYPGLEIVVPLSSGPFKWVHAFHSDGTLVNGWPQNISGLPSGIALYENATLADIDINYPGLEVIIPRKMSWEGGGFSKIYAWHSDGTPVSGWPKTLFHNLAYSVAVGDLDPHYPGDEIVIGLENMNIPEQTVLNAWHGDGANVPGFPIVTNNFITKVILADIDEDGQLEIMGGTGKSTYGWPQYPAMVYAWYSNGEIVEGWPITINNNVTSLSLSVGNVDGQRGLEIVASDQNNIYIWHDDATSLDGWPVAVNAVPVGEPLIADIGQHNDMEILLALQSGTIKVWHSNGQLARITLQAQSSICSSPAIADIDFNGTTEIVACSSSSGSGTGYVDIWDLRSYYNPQDIEWGEFRHDERRSGLYTPPQ